MADKRIWELGDAGVVSDTDYLHIAQSSQDYRITIADLSNKFGEVDIWGITENVAPAGADAIATVDVSSGTSIADNRKVTLDNISNLFQTQPYFTTRVYWNLNDSYMIYRAGDAADELSQIPLSIAQLRFLKFPDLTNTLTAGDQADSICVWDYSSALPTRMTYANLRLGMLDPTSLSENTTVDSGDYFYTYDISETVKPRKITYTNLFNKLQSDLNTSQFVSIASTQTVTGSKTFTAQTKFSNAAGITTDKISSYTPAAPISINLVQLNSGNVYAGILYGQVKPDSTKQSKLLTGSDTHSVFQNIASGYNNTSSSGLGDWLEVYGANTSTGDISNYARGGILPNLSGVYNLGTSDREWDGIYSQKGYFSDGVVSRGQSRFNTIYVDNQQLNNGSLILKERLPSATTSDKGAVTLATGTDVAGVLSENAITPNSLYNARNDLVHRGSARNTAGSTINNTAVYAGSIKLGGLIINYGYIEYNTSYNYDIVIFRLNYAAYGMQAFTNDNSYSVTLQTQAEGGSRERDYVNVESSSRKTHLDIFTNRTNAGWETSRIYFQVIGN